MTNINTWLAKSVCDWEFYQAKSCFIMKALFILLYINSTKLIENNQNFVFFDYKVSTQQHFESRLSWKNAKKLRIYTRLASLVSTPEGRCSSFSSKVKTTKWFFTVLELLVFFYYMHATIFSRCNKHFYISLYQFQNWNCHSMGYMILAVHFL